MNKLFCSYQSKRTRTQTSNRMQQQTVPSTATFSLSESNAKVKELISKETPFFIARLSDIETKVALKIAKNAPLLQRDVQVVQNNAGIYISELKDLQLYSQIYNNAVASATALACFPALYTQEQNYWLKEKGMEKGLFSRVLEPFYVLEEGEQPWTHLLSKKRILIVSPFAKSFSKQIEAGFIFDNEKDASRQIFDSTQQQQQQFVIYKAYNTQAGNHPHKNWFETFAIMCKEIKELNEKQPFDIALLSCGGYGLPLSNYIFKTLKKSAVYVGGGLQLLFGVNGKRWTNHPIISRVSNLPNNKWIRPSEDEIPQNSTSIEGGCYW